MTLSGTWASTSFGGEGVGGLVDSEEEDVGAGVGVKGKRRAFTTETKVEVSQRRRVRSMMRRRPPSSYE